MDVVVDFAGVEGETAAVRWQHPLTFQVPRGSALLIRTKSAFSGPLFRLCLGFSEPRHGRVTINGKNPSGLSRNDVRDLRRQLGCALEPDGLVANLSIRMNLIVPLVFATGLDLDEATERAATMLDVMHLKMWAEARPPSLPAEVRQTAALARALCPQPGLLLLENPLASVDQREARRLMSLCRMQSETLLIVSYRDDPVLRDFADSMWAWDDDGFRKAA